MASQGTSSQVKEVQKGSKKKRRGSKHTRRNYSPRLSSHLTPQPFGDPSQFNWFWQNYYNVFQWQQRHQVAYWKSRSLALEYENNLLHQYLQSKAFNDANLMCYPNRPLNAYQGNSQEYNSEQFEKSEMPDVDEHSQESPEHDDDDDADAAAPEEENDNEMEFEFQVTEEMMDFFEQSIRHKMELQKEREKEKVEAAENKGFDNAHLPPKRRVGLKRTKEMNLMYGKAAPMILGMETAMQLSFDRNCDLKQPRLWPNIPLRL